MNDFVLIDINNKDIDIYFKKMKFFSIFKNKIVIFIHNIIANWGLGIGDWGLGIGDWAQSPIPNPQSPFINKILYNYLL
jgi:hypothetical protein